LIWGLRARLQQTLLSGLQTGLLSGLQTSVGRHSEPFDGIPTIM